MPIHRRLPKRGFKNYFKQPFQIINLAQLNSIPETEIDIDLLKSTGLVQKIEVPVKLLGEGEINRSIKVTVNAISASARTKIENAGGEVRII
jgi:large subunit ribosomal protein L15